MDVGFCAGVSTPHAQGDGKPSGDSTCDEVGKDVAGKAGDNVVEVSHELLLFSGMFPA